MSEPWVSVDDVARHFDVSKDTIYRWVVARKIPTHRVGRLWKFQTAEVTAWVTSGGDADAGHAGETD